MRVWRLLAVLSCLVWLIVLVADNLIFILDGTEIKIVTYNNILVFSYLLLSILWAIFPHKFMLFGFLCCFIGIEGVLTPPVNITNCLLMYLLGCVFIYKQRYELNNNVVKVSFILLPLVAIIPQFRFDIVYMLKSFLDVAFIAMFFLLVWFLLKDSFTITKKMHDEYEGKIDLSVLKPIELEILREVLNNKTYFAIALEKNKSESAVKFIMRDIYNKLNVTGKKELVELYERNVLLLPQ